MWFFCIQLPEKNDIKNSKIKSVKPFEILLVYNLISFIVITIGLIFCKKVIRKDSVKDKVLKMVSILVVAIHMSSLYVDFFTNKGEAIIENNLILPIYPCNIIMWLLVIVSFMKNKESKLFNHLAEFTFIGGTLCGVIGVLFNTNFLNNPDLKDYDILKGLLSHSVMIFGTIYLYVLGYIRINVVRTTKSIIFGLSIFTCIGFIINTLFKIFGLESVNAMFMESIPFASLPYINYLTIGLMGILLSFIGLNIYEVITMDKEDRWITKIRKKVT